MNLIRKALDYAFPNECVVLSVIANLILGLTYLLEVVSTPT